MTGKYVVEELPLPPSEVAPKRVFDRDSKDEARMYWEQETTVGGRPRLLRVIDRDTGAEVFPLLGPPSWQKAEWEKALRKADYAVLPYQTDATQVVATKGDWTVTISTGQPGGFTEIIIRDHEHEPEKFLNKLGVLIP